MDNRTYTAFCGLYCRDCIPSHPRVYSLIEELLREFDAIGFANYAAHASEKSSALAEFPTAEAVLREALKLKCSGSCFEGPHSELGCNTDCPIRTCVAERHLAGCWECAERRTCEHIEPLARFHPGLRANLDAIAEHGIEGWVEHRSRHYSWSAGRSGRESTSRVLRDSF